MMIRRLIIILFFLFSNEVVAGQFFSCSGTQVSIEVVKSDRSAYAADSVVRVELDDAVTILRYQNIDYIGGKCLKDARGLDKVLYQAHCGGSRCKDLDNWGIINPHNLKVLLKPDDSNREEAQKILGISKLNISDKLSVEKEKVKLGIPLI